MTVIDRFLKLVSYPTTSDERSQTCPSTPQQRVLAEELVRQMQDHLPGSRSLNVFCICIQDIHRLFKMQDHVSDHRFKR